MHEQRLSYKEASPEAFKALLHTEMQVHKTGIEESLLELVKMRASQINGCAWCLEMHTKDARAQGETEQRLYLLAAWRDAHCYTPRARAALAWTEEVTRVANTQDVSDAAWEDAHRQFSDKELVDLTLAIIAINGWNRLAIPFRSDVGGYQPAKK